MVENLPIISYWKICGLSQNEIDEIIIKLNSPNDTIEHSNIKTTAKKETSSEKSDDIQHFDTTQSLSESTDFNREESKNPKLFDYRFLLPSNYLKNSKLQIADIAKLDKVFQSSFEAGVKQGISGIVQEVQYDEDFIEEQQELCKVWSDAGYKTGVTWGMVNSV